MFTWSCDFWDGDERRCHKQHCVCYQLHFTNVLIAQLPKEAGVDSDSYHPLPKVLIEIEGVHLWHTYSKAPWQTFQENGKVFLLDEESKQNFLLFLFNEWKKYIYAIKLLYLRKQVHLPNERWWLHDLQSLRNSDPFKRKQTQRLYFSVCTFQLEVHMILQ